MYIEKLHIESFGKLSNLDIEFKRGLNIVEGENECGKSTLAAFIKFILYGVTAKEREGILSWKSGGAAGTINLVSDDGSIRLRVERGIVGSREVLQLIDANTNMQIRNLPAGKSIGEILFGVDKDIFSATAFVSQISDNSGGATVGGSKISDGIENILFSADESVNTQKAASKLDLARAALLHKNEKGGLLYETQRKCAATEARLAAATEKSKEINLLEGQLADIKERLNDAEKKSEDAAVKADKCEAWILLKLFDKASDIKKRLASLSSHMSKEDAAEIAKASELERTIQTLSLLGEEAKKSEDISKISDKERDPKLTEYINRGGRQGVEGEKLILKTHAKTFTLCGIITLVVGFIMLALGCFPILVKSEPRIVLIALAALFMAGGVTLLFLSKKKSVLLSELDGTFDLDILDKAIAEEKSAEEAENLARLAAESAKKRYSDALSAAEEKYGTPAEFLPEKLALLKEKQRKYGEVQVEYDKETTLLAQIEEQLQPYNEGELRQTLGNDTDMDETNAENLQALRREADFLKKQAEALEKLSSELEKKLAGLYPTVENPAALSDELEELKLKCTELEKKHAAYKLAYEKLTAAGESLRAGVSPKLAADSARLLAHITGGRYKELGIGSDLDMSVTTEAGLRPLSVLSAGTKDAAYLSLRLALISLLYRLEQPPVIYDEAFSRQDNGRLSNILRLVRAGSTQSIVFSSNSREATLAAPLGEFNHIKL